MESDSTVDYEKQKEHRDSLLDDSDISEPIRLCGAICFGNEVYRRLLDYNVYLLCVGGIVLLGGFLFA
jgi:hypothetical protein